jgi:hypothetical protein
LTRTEALGWEQFRPSAFRSSPVLTPELSLAPTLAPRRLLFASGSAQAEERGISPKEVPMGDKSPKSKQRNQSQKDAVKKQDANAAKNKQAAQGQQAAAAKAKK